MSRRKPKRKPTKNPAPPLSRRRLWSFRLIALIGAPLLFFGLLELGLRLAGFGYPTAFFLKSSNRGEKTFVQNNQFGWRFFGRRMARLPGATSIPREKPPGTFRIFVFGESAALGDPRPNYGAGSYLEVLLAERFPQAKFEIINTSVTAINSHAILPIARECAGHAGDLWIIYMGNNEMVGPFGAATVFGTRAPPLWWVRMQLQLRQWRLSVCETKFFC